MPDIRWIEGKKMDKMPRNEKVFLFGKSKDNWFDFRPTKKKGYTIQQRSTGQNTLDSYFTTT